jgi:hypothetical protein
MTSMKRVMTDCMRCSRPVVLEYLATPGGLHTWPCPYDGCGMVHIQGHPPGQFSRVLTADPRAFLHDDEPLKSG